MNNKSLLPFISFICSFSLVVSGQSIDAQNLQEQIGKYSSYNHVLKTIKKSDGERMTQLFFMDYDTTTPHTVFSLKRADIASRGVSAPVTLFVHQGGLNIQSYSLQLSADGSKLAVGRNRVWKNQTDFLNEPTIDIVLYHLLPDGNLNTALGENGITYIDIPHAPGVEESVTSVVFNNAGNRLFVSMAKFGIYYINNLTRAKPLVTAIGLTSMALGTSVMEHIHHHGTESILAGTDNNTIYRLINLNTGVPYITLFCTECPVEKRQAPHPGKPAGESYIYSINANWIEENTQNRNE